MTLPSLARPCLAVLLAACLGPLAGCRAGEDRETQTLARAQEHLARGRVDEAIAELDAALAQGPESASLHDQLAHLLSRARRGDEALVHYEEAYRLDPSRNAAGLNAAALLRFEDPDRAGELVARVLERSPRLPLAHIRRSELALDRGDEERALDSARKALELAPDSPRAQLNLGLVLGARIASARVAGAGPPDAAIYRSALEALEQAFEGFRGPKRGRALVERARLLASWPGHEDEAAAAFRRLVEFSFTEDRPVARVPAARAAADFARKTGDPELGRWSLEKLLEADDEQLWAWAELAALAETGGGSGEAIFERLLERRPDDARAHGTYVRFLADRKRLDEAVAHAEQAAARGVAPPKLLGLVARLYYDRGRDEDAARLTERLEREHPDAPETKEALALAAIRDGRPADAIEILSGVAAAEASAESAYLLALAYLRRGQVAPAVQAIQRADRLSTGFAPRILRLKLRIDHAAGRWEDVLRGLRGLGQRGLSPTRPERVMSVKALYALGQQAAAREALEPLLAEPNPPVDAVLEFSRREHARDPERAYALLERAHAGQATEARVLHALTLADLADGNAARAVDRLQRVGEEHPEALSISVVLDRARALSSAGRLEEAERDLVAVLQRRPDHPEASELLVTLYGRQGRLEEAIASLEEADRSAALPAASRVVLARLYRGAGRADEARAALERALGDRDDFAVAKGHLAVLLAERGEDLDRALELAQELTGAGRRDPAAAHALGYVYLRKELAEAAEVQLARAVELAQQTGKESAVFHYHHGLALRKLGRSEEALVAFDAALALDPGHGGAERARAELRAEPGAAPAKADPS